MKRLTLVSLVLAVLLTGVIGTFAVRSSVEASDETVFDGDTEWGAERSVGGDIIIRDWVTIPEGSRLTILPGATVFFDGGNLSVMGKIEFRGTPNNRIMVKSKSGEYDGYNIQVYGKLWARNTTFSDGGSNSIYMLRNFFISTAYAYGERGVVNVGGNGSIDIVHCRFENNSYSIITNASDTVEKCSGEGDERVCTDVIPEIPVVRVWESVFEGTGWQNNKVWNQHEKAVDFRYNFWNGENPQEWKDRNDILGSVRTDEWTASSAMRDPVVIVPGILGSYPVLVPQNDEERWKETGETVWKLDPLLNSYDDLYKAFEDNGYVSEETLFAFPYDWERSNVDTANDFAGKIADIKAKTHRPFVDVVSHSMGGLVARQYIQSEGYRDDIDQLITLGTPNEGSVDAYLKWEGGYLFPESVSDKVGKYVFESWAKHAGYASVFDFIRGKPIASIEELLPVSDYLFDGDSKRAYPNNCPTNTFLERLNATNTEVLRRVTTERIVGRMFGDKGTVTGLNVSDMNRGDLWKKGYPNDIENEGNKSKSIVFGSGDRTVSLSSARSENLFADSITEIAEGSHQKLPSMAKDIVYKMITGESPAKKKSSSFVDKILGVFAFSPIDIQVTAPDGKRVGKNFEQGGEYNEIPGAYYTGYATDSEFLTIPNPLDGVYTVKTQGVSGGGSYRLKTVSITEGADDIVIEHAGTAQNGVIQASAVTVSNGSMVLPKEEAVSESETTTSTITTGESVVSASKAPSKTSSNDDSEGDSDKEKKESKKSSLTSATKLFQKPKDTNAPSDSASEQDAEYDAEQNVGGSESKNPPEVVENSIPEKSSFTYWAIAVGTFLGSIWIIRNKKLLRKIFPRNPPHKKTK